MSEQKASKGTSKDKGKQQKDKGDSPPKTEGKVVVYDPKTDKFYMTMTNTSGLLPDYQKIMEEAKQTCKGNVDESVIKSCKEHHQDKLYDSLLKNTLGIGGDGPVSPTGDIDSGYELDESTGTGKKKDTSFSGGLKIEFN